jgi:hypothetical protein
MDTARVNKAVTAECTVSSTQNAVMFVIWLGHATRSNSVACTFTVCTDVTVILLWDLWWTQRASVAITNMIPQQSVLLLALLKTATN